MRQVGDDRRAVGELDLAAGPTGHRRRGGDHRNGLAVVAEHLIPHPSSAIVVHPDGVGISVSRASALPSILATRSSGRPTTSAVEPSTNSPGWRMKASPSSISTRSVRSLRSFFTSMTGAVWLRKTRNSRSRRRSTDDGWMHDSSRGSITMRPAAQLLADGAVRQDHRTATLPVVDSAPASAARRAWSPSGLPWGARLLRDAGPSPPQRTGQETDGHGHERDDRLVEPGLPHNSSGTTTSTAPRTTTMRRSGRGLGAGTAGRRTRARGRRGSRDPRSCERAAGRVGQDLTAAESLGGPDAVVVGAVHEVGPPHDLQQLASGLSATHASALRVLAEFRSASGRSGSATRRGSPTVRPVASSFRSRHSVSPMLVDDGTKASMTTQLRTVQGTNASTITAIGTAVTATARRHPHPVARTARNTPRRTGSENGRTSPQAARTAPRRRAGARSAGPWTSRGPR